MHVITD